ncbi:hypothetical protein EHI8A_192240 [Entamoeba histolytica HM-1:IMSS-B]|uniref:Uncharacterized protein n=2 Tax=Entamoeba histolytica (strain ATCC 30459 / HM-1:IMSS / ABRM) TaxID=294381 RepID=M3UHN5_ENTH1|nr:hypothetical protein EHI8A_192240 [Entamoeba histolytica HM-1:IMSS-B]ENY65510.1 unknown protein, putative [Entamoeba histolytica HM-1:IMSS-A]
MVIKRMCNGILVTTLSEIMQNIKEQLDFHLERDNFLFVRCLIYWISYFQRRWTFENYKFDSLVMNYLDFFIEDCHSLLIGGERLAKLLIALRNYT